LRLAILCRDENLHAVRRITVEARRRRHRVQIMDPYRTLLKIVRGEVAIEFEGKSFGGADVFMPRLGAGISNHSLALVRHLEISGCLVINSCGALDIARDKLRTAQLFVRAGLPSPRTAFAPDPIYLPRALELVGGPPAVIKLPRSTKGHGVMIAETLEAAQSIADAMWALERDVIVQEFVREAKGSDLRVLVVGGKAVRAVRRRASRGEFRSNLHQGGTAYPARLTRHAAILSERAAEVCGLDIAGVDLLQATGELKVLEVNAAPGIEGFECAGDERIVSLIVDYIETRWEEWRTPGRG